MAEAIQQAKQNSEERKDQQNDSKQEKSAEETSENVLKFDYILNDQKEKSQEEKKKELVEKAAGLFNPMQSAQIEASVVDIEKTTAFYEATLLHKDSAV